MRDTSECKPERKAWGEKRGENAEGDREAGAKS